MYLCMSIGCVYLSVRRLNVYCIYVCEHVCALYVCVSVLVSCACCMCVHVLCVLDVYLGVLHAQLARAEYAD